MTRIVAGGWKGHPLPRFKHGSVRPTTERARTVLFDTLGSRVKGQVLDLYSGTGALGFEALSRGALGLISVDRDRRYIQAQKLWMERHAHERSFQAIRGCIPGILKKIRGPFDLVLADPPYGEPVDPNLVTYIRENLHEEGLFVLERDKSYQGRSLDPGLILFKEKMVADTLIQLYKVVRK